MPKQAIHKYLEDVDLDRLEQQIIYYKDHLDIAIEDLCYPTKLSKHQHVIARMCGRCSEVKNVQSRGAGKTWLTAYIAHVLCVLNPETLVGIVSATEMQATLVLKKLKAIAESNANVRNELAGKIPVVVNDHKGRAVYKNGSCIESYSLVSVRGARAKILIVDEAPEIDQRIYEAAASPVRNYTRPICVSYGFKDFPSKEICLTSACEQSNGFYSRFKDTVNKMRKGNPEAFACALSYEASVQSGLTDEEFFMEEKRRMPDITFAMEYGSIFVGSSTESAFPFRLVLACRSLEEVELVQPKNSKARYIISVDIATSADENADNTVISVLKFIERNDYTFNKKLVYMKTFHGKSLDVIAKEVRHLFHDCFPNTEKIIYDARGVGDSFDRFMDKEYVDASGVEHPPLTVDDSINMNSSAVPLLHPFRAVQALNQRMYINVRVCLEKHSVEIPISSRIAEQRDMEKRNEDKMNFYVKCVHQEADALHYEMGNIVAKPGANGTMLYDTPKQRQHKDRYSSFAMGIDYICELEKENIKRRNRSKMCVGIATEF